VVENGTVLTFTSDSMTIGDRVPGGYVYVDGSGVGDIGPAVMRDREILGRDGFVIVNVLVDRDTHELLADPEIISRGFVFLREATNLLEGAQHTIRTVTGSNGRSSARKLREEIERSLDKYFYNETKRRPMIFALVNEA
jgi:ribonuclease J